MYYPKPLPSFTVDSTQHMSYSKSLSPCTYDLLCYLNRDQLERFSIVCRPLKNLVDRYFRSKPYRVFDELFIRGESCALFNNNLRWHPNQKDYSGQQFLAGNKKCNIQKCNNPWNGPIYSTAYFPFAEMRPYLGPTVRINVTLILFSENSIYNPDHIEEMESISYLWREGKIRIWNISSQIVDFQSILNSPTILQCQNLNMDNTLFSFKDYKVLYTVKVIETFYGNNYFDPNCWLEFLDQPGVKPLVVFLNLHREQIVTLLDRLAKLFSSAVSPNAFKIVFAQRTDSLAEFRETNKSSREMFELKKGLPAGYQKSYLENEDNYTLERSSI